MPLSPERPPHLLGLLRLSHMQLGSMCDCKHVPRNNKSFPTSTSLSISAVELAEISVTLKPSAHPWFGDMCFRRGHLFGKLSLSPVFLNDVTACWLVNMVALEASTSGSSAELDGYVVSSYLSVLAMLVDRVEDAQKLRSKYILYGTFSNTQALRFFKGLAQYLRFGESYFVTLDDIEAYKRHRPVRNATYKFVYNNYKAIAAVLSIAGVIISILNALYSHKKS